MECPDTNTMQALVAGQLAPEAHSEILGHTETCQDCRVVLATLVREGAPTEELPAARAMRSTALPVHGMRMGRYEIQTLLGIGGLSIVYAAHDPELDRRVALKLLRLEAAGEARATQARLVREARAMARVSHPNIVAVYDVGQWGDRVFLAMELVEGTDLRGWLERESRSVGEIVDAFIEAGRGLAAAHAAGLVHRDFKPENVLVNARGRVQVTDFGLAHLDETKEEGGLSSEDAPFGTPLYMAPEQHHDDVVDGRTDQFSFCVALYDALYGEPPFSGHDYESLRGAVVSGRVNPPPRGARVSAGLRRILLRGLSVDRADRFPSMEALLAALAHDRSRVARRIALSALGLLLVVFATAIGDGIVRARLYAATRSTFAGARQQMRHMLALRYEAFSALANLSTNAMMMREVTATRDQSEFGLGVAKDDARRLERLHATLRDADWDAWGEARRRGEVAVADYKGRLLFSTGNPNAFGENLQRLPAIAAAYRSAGSGAQVVRRDDPELVASGLLAPGEANVLCILFAHGVVLAGVPQATFLQIIDGRRLLDDLRLDPELRLALVAPDGSVDGDLPRALVITHPGAELVETTVEGRPWLLQSQPIPALAAGAPPIATLVVGRPVDVGLAGLFPHARTVLFTLGALGLLTFLLAAWRLFANDERRRVRLFRPRASS